MPDPDKQPAPAKKSNTQVQFDKLVDSVTETINSRLIKDGKNPGHYANSSADLDVMIKNMQGSVLFPPVTVSDTGRDGKPQTTTIPGVEVVKLTQIMRATAVANGEQLDADGAEKNSQTFNREIGGKVKDFMAKVLERQKAEIADPSLSSTKGDFKAIYAEERQKLVDEYEKVKGKLEEQDVIKDPKKMAVDEGRPKGGFSKPEGSVDKDAIRNKSTQEQDRKNGGFSKPEGSVDKDAIRKKSTQEQDRKNGGFSKPEGSVDKDAIRNKSTQEEDRKHGGFSQPKGAVDKDAIRNRDQGWKPQDSKSQGRPNGGFGQPSGAPGKNRDLQPGQPKMKGRDYSAPGAPPKNRGGKPPQTTSIELPHDAYAMLQDIKNGASWQNTKTADAKDAPEKGGLAKPENGREYT